MRTWAAAVRCGSGAYAPVTWANGALRAECEASDRAAASLAAARAAWDCLQARQAAAISAAEASRAIAAPSETGAAAPTQLGLHAAWSAQSAKQLRRAARPKAVVNAAIAASIPIDRMRWACRSWVLSVPAPSAAGTKQLSTEMSSSSLMAAGEGHGVFRACCAWYMDMGHRRSTVATTSRVGHTRSPSARRSVPCRKNSNSNTPTRTGEREGYGQGLSDGWQ